MSKHLERTGNIWHHTKAMCDGAPCPFHAPSLHAMIEEPMHLRETGLIERLCKHGVGHPDPDSAAYWDRVYGHESGTWMMHGCDGCCQLPTRSG
jgi:hypothetical protein